MGVCLSCKTSSTFKIKSQTYATQTQTTDRQQNLDKYCQDPNTLNKYNVILSNIKVKIQEQVNKYNYFKRTCQVIFSFSHFCSCTSHVSFDQNGRHIFKILFQSSILINEVDLRKSYLEVLIKDSSSNMLSTIKINLYEVATGPPHFDYNFQETSPNPKNGLMMVGKISFDLKLSQVVVIQLQSGKVLCNMQENLTKQAYSYSMKLVTHNQTFLSDYSELFINPAYTSQPQESLKEISSQDSDQLSNLSPSPLPLGLKKLPSIPHRYSLGGISRSNSKNVVLFNDHQTGANFKVLQWNDKKGILLDIEVPINQIPAASLQLCFWGANVQENDDVQILKEQVFTIHQTLVTNNLTDESIVKDKVESIILICETYISLNQIFKHDQGEDFEIKDGIRVYQYTQEVNKGLWNHGIQEGTIQCSFNIRVPAYLKQAIVGVRTNKSIQQASSVISKSHISVQEIQQLQIFVIKLIESVYKLQYKNQTDSDRFNWTNILNNNIQNIISVLQKSHKESIMSFYYKNQNELLKAQETLLQLATHLITTADDLDDTAREKYYLILKLIMDRGELALNQMGFGERTEATSQKQYKQKLQVGFIYQKFLYNTLKIVLEKLKQKAYSDNERSYIEGFCARSYFQIPEFRVKFQACLVRPDDPPLVEWRGTEYNLDQDFEDNQYHNKDLIDLFDWEYNFYQYLDKEKKGQENRVLLNEILSQTEWQKRFGKRSRAFFMFVREWCIHVDKKVIVKEHIPWQDIPGYRPLVKAFLIEIKSREIKQFPLAIKQSIFALLQNYSLLNIFIVLLFNKTQYKLNSSSLYDSAGVIELFEILNQAFQQLIQHNKRLPTQVDLPFFLRGIRAVLKDCDHALCISKCLWMLYNNYTIFPSIKISKLIYIVDFKKDLCDLLFPNLATKFFMHWSQIVRMMFQHFMVYRIHHLHLNNKTPEIDDQTLIHQTKQVTQQIKHQSYFDSNRVKNQIIVNIYEKTQSDYIYSKFLRVLQLTEQQIEISQEENKQLPTAERTYAKQMRQKLLLKKRMLNVTNQQISEILPKASQQQGFYVEDINDPHSSPQLTGINNQFQEGLDKLILYQSQDEIIIDGSKQLDKSQNSKTLESRVHVTQNQIKYLSNAHAEFNEIKLRWAKWRHLNIVKYKNVKFQNDEEKDQFLEKFEIPRVNLQVPIDEKEQNIYNDDDW